MNARLALPTWLRRIAASVVLAATATGAQATVLAAEQAAFGGTTLISFEDVANLTSLTTQYSAQGIVDFNAPVLGANGYAKAVDAGMFFLPGGVSGQQVGSFAASIQFAADIDRVGVWLYKNNGQQYLTALDAAQNVLLTVAEDANSNDAANYDFVGVVSSAKNIRYIVLSNTNLSQQPDWQPTGLTTFYDNLMFTPINAVAAPVPEPQTWLLMLASLAVMGLLMRRRRIASEQS